MVGIAYGVVCDHHLAEDAAQETFAIACRDLGRLKRPARFANWLRGICRNVARSMVRRKMGVAVTRDVPAPADDAADCPTDEIVWKCVGQLPASEREAVVLRYFSGLKGEQIAATLGISLQAVYGRLKRGKRRMAEDLKAAIKTGPTIRPEDAARPPAASRHGTRKPSC